MRNIKRFILIACCSLCSCHYLDIVPDNIATVEYAFRMRSTAEKYLFTLYSYQPHFADPYNYPVFLGGDEIWCNQFDATTSKPAWQIAMGFQNIVDPYSDYWSGGNGGRNLFVAIRDCNTFLENIGSVPDMDDFEKKRWAAEARFLKAYYHFFLLRMYGPVPITDKNLPISSGPEAVRVYREPVDSCVNYIAGQLDQAAADLPDIITDEISEQGRITRPAALAIKARLLVMAASPLFNGNPDYADFVDKRGLHLFSQEADPGKWQRAADACKEAIDACQAAGKKLYYYTPAAFVPANISEATKTEMNIRNAVCEKWNPEIIWASTDNVASSLQRESLPFLYAGQKVVPKSTFAPPLKIAELFYTKNGVPISEDKSWDYNNRYKLRTATHDEQLYIKEGYTTAVLNFDREPRFYADLGFDGGRWYGQGRYGDTDNVYVAAKLGQTANNHAFSFSITGYWPKKLVNYLDVSNAEQLTFQNYPWPVMRLGDLYLLYAEALNEVSGPGGETYKWIDLVRQRAGLPSVEESWTQYSNRPGEYQTRDGLRKIIHQERLIEMAFEGQRFWDLRRWKEAEEVMNEPVRGWNYTGKDESNYYQVRVLFSPIFKKRDYLWPVKEQHLIVNSNLMQNPGW
ncbi:RagB/SusD family nutrient uptake outer membrane protein [Compostibacter hankyongensis]|uniref:RagB/SusD family nutrient uptake outer membrane protein n=1 Tax=Compostibacter hankyongensis TaxID=1007089 RepID=A0ABP8FVD4_9BACT